MGGGGGGGGLLTFPANRVGAYSGCAFNRINTIRSQLKRFLTSVGGHYREQFFSLKFRFDTF